MSTGSEAGVFEVASPAECTVEAETSMTKKVKVEASEAELPEQARKRRDEKLVRSFVSGRLAKTDVDEEDAVTLMLLLLESGLVDVQELLD
jgi:hypothetical protein